MEDRLKWLVTAAIAFAVLFVMGDVVLSDHGEVRGEVITKMWQPGTVSSGMVQNPSTGDIGYQVSSTPDQYLLAVKTLEYGVLEVPTDRQLFHLIPEEAEVRVCVRLGHFTGSLWSQYICKEDWSW